MLCNIDGFVVEAYDGETPVGKGHGLHVTSVLPCIIGAGVGAAEVEAYGSRGEVVGISEHLQRRGAFIVVVVAAYDNPSEVAHAVAYALAHLYPAQRLVCAHYLVGMGVGGGIGGIFCHLEKRFLVDGFQKGGVFYVLDVLEYGHHLHVCRGIGGELAVIVVFLPLCRAEIGPCEHFFQRVGYLDVERAVADIHPFAVAVDACLEVDIYSVAYLLCLYLDVLVVAFYYRCELLLEDIVEGKLAERYGDEPCHAFLHGADEVDGRHTVVVFHLHRGFAVVVGHRNGAVTPSRKVVAVDEEFFHVVHLHLIAVCSCQGIVKQLGVEDAALPVVRRLNVEQVAQWSFGTLVVDGDVL